MNLVEPDKLIMVYRFKYRCERCSDIFKVEKTGIEIYNKDLKVKCNNCGYKNKLSGKEVGIIVSMLNGREWENE